ncbi:hypothetical protein ACVW06_000337 [Pantoea ananatis]
MNYIFYFLMSISLFLYVEPVFAINESAIQPIKTSCDENQYTLFSCTSKKELVDLCIDKKKKEIKFVNHEYKVSIRNIEQVASVASGGGATILQGDSKDGKFTIFLDDNHADESDSVVSIGKRPLLYCDKNSINTPINFLRNEHGFEERIEIWNLLNINISRPFFEKEVNRKEKNRKLMKLWASWPEKNK